MNRREFTLSTLFAGIGGVASLTSNYAYGGVGGPTGAYINPIIDVRDYFDKDMASKAYEPVGMTLVLGVDISSSIAPHGNEFHAQLNAIAESFENHDLRETIFGEGGPGSLAVFLLDFDHQSQLQIGGVDFRENHPAKFMEYAERVRSVKRRNDAGSTSHPAFLYNANICLHRAQERWPCRKNYVDIMTDGVSFDKEEVKDWIRKLATRYGAVVSSMATRIPDYYRNVPLWCEQNLRTPAKTYRGPDGQFVPEGSSAEIATHGKVDGENVIRYRYNVHRALRNHIRQEASNRQFQSPTQFAGNTDLAMSDRRLFFTSPSSLAL